jgi:hypothetical protein
MIGVFRGSENPLPAPLVFDNLLDASAGYRFLNSDDAGFFNLIEASVGFDLGAVTLSTDVVLDVQLAYQQFGVSLELAPTDFISLEFGVERASFGNNISTDFFGLQTSGTGAMTRGEVGLVISTDLENFAEHLKNSVNVLKVSVGFAGDVGFRAGLPGDRQTAHLILEESLRVNITRQSFIEPYYVFSEAELLAPAFTVRIRRNRIPIVGHFGTRFVITPSDSLAITIDGAIGGGFSLSTGLSYHLF